ncbi:major Facilitator superfamily protein [Mycolicibacterium canariasense]|uniref:Major Facilitator superfamily protein n=1 Tax=Mycolicibacterium canariasense TaxID=228230 RepID=A0A100WI83_MYCCR|nr:MFS transporter [Mycolicibacterium canariasense]ORV08181.1 MFS transporter [Mycolicibacterium canariasense]GAS98273.1 major Facilitator superfamily protein [Mycolicibacterium canariasense]
MSLRDSRVSRGAPADRRTRAGAILAAVISCVAAFKGLNESVTPPALPILQEEFQVPGSTISWVLTGMLLTGTIATPIASRLGEVWDKRRTLLCVLAIVATGTLMSALSVSIEMLIIGQLLQGVGLSTVPLAIGIIRDTQSEARTKSANGILVGAIYGSTAAGTMVAGPIADHLSYRWLFWVPFIALAGCMAAVWCFVPRTARTSGKRPSIDVAGSVLLAIGLACILLALTFAPGWGWRSGHLLLLFAAGLVAIIAFVRVELTVDDPLIDLRLMRSFTVVASSGLMFLAGYCINATLINIPVQTQLPVSTGYGLGGSATVTSVILVTTTLIGLTAPLISVLDRLIGSRFASSIGPISILGGAVLMLTAGHRGSLAVVFLATSFVIFGLTVSMTQSLNLVVTGVPANKVTEFNGLNFAIQAVAGTIGAQVSGAALTVDGGEAGAPPPWSGFAISWGISGVIAIAALVLVLALRTPKVSAP